VLDSFARETGIRERERERKREEKEGGREWLHGRRA
jgi:hypothetical protein